MSESIGPETSAIERMLHDRARQGVPSALRTRVLADVSDVLHKTVRGPGAGKGLPGHAPRYADVVPAALLMVTALSLLLVATLPSAAAFHRDGPTAERHLLSFAQRAEAAGIALDREPASSVRLAGDRSRYHAGNAAHVRTILRSIDARSFLQGEL